MDAKRLEQLALLLADELDEGPDDLDSMENRLVSILKDVGQRALQVKQEGKKGATRAAGSPAPADRRPAS